MKPEGLGLAACSLGAQASGRRKSTAEFKSPGGVTADRLSVKLPSPRWGFWGGTGHPFPGARAPGYMPAPLRGAQSLSRHPLTQPDSRGRPPRVTWRGPEVARCPRSGTTSRGLDCSTTEPPDATQTNPQGLRHCPCITSECTTAFHETLCNIRDWGRDIRPGEGSGVFVCC
jgi:hypothetical protein